MLQFPHLWKLLCHGSELLCRNDAQLGACHTESNRCLLYQVDCRIHGPLPGTEQNMKDAFRWRRGSGKPISEQQDGRGADSGGRGTGCFQPGNQLAAVPAWKKDWMAFCFFTKANMQWLATFCRSLIQYEIVRHRDSQRP